MAAVALEPRIGIDEMTLTQLLQIIIALGIANVWLLRPRRPSAFRGGAAPTMAEEFAAYGLPAWSVKVVGALKLLCATGLLLGVWVPGLTQPAAALLAVLMAGAVAMHVKISDPALRSLPAVSLLVACLVVLAG